MELLKLSLLTVLSLLLTYSLLSAAAPRSDEGPRPSYLDFVFSAMELPSIAKDYDYIIVGGGTAGCPLAATLSKKYRVLVLERGGIPFEYPSTLNQDGFWTTLTQVDTGDSPAELFTSLDGVPNARGRLLGGSSSINAGFYSRADEEFFEKSGFWWDRELVNQSYKWIEKTVAFRPQLDGRWQTAVIEGLLETGVWPYHGYSFDHVIGTKIGGSTFDRMGQRHTAADLLNDAHPTNINVAIRASVERILINSASHSGKTNVQLPKAIGVEYRDQKGHLHRAILRDKGEVILCAGAIGSPQLLLLSGVGSVKQLSAWGIPVIHRLSSVGAYMSDNPRNGITLVISQVPLNHSLIQAVGITDEGSYIEAASRIVSVTTPPHNPSHSSVKITVATIMEKISGPLSVGWLQLASADVKVSPVVKFNYFKNEEDLERCVKGVRKIGEVLKGRAMDRFRTERWHGVRDFTYMGERLPEKQLDDRLMGEFCKRTVNTIWHYHGGCVVGKAVDGDHRVIGVDRLRVVDGSTFIQSPGTNPQATVMMLGRYMGVKILEESKRKE